MAATINRLGVDAKTFRKVLEFDVTSFGIAQTALALNVHPRSIMRWRAHRTLPKQQTRCAAIVLGLVHPRRMSRLVQIRLKAAERLARG